MKDELVLKIVTEMLRNLLLHNSNVMTNKNLVINLECSKQYLDRMLAYKSAFRIKELEEIGIYKKKQGTKVIWVLDVGKLQHYLDRFKYLNF